MQASGDHHEAVAREVLAERAAPDRSFINCLPVVRELLAVGRDRPRDQQPDEASDLMGKDGWLAVELVEHVVL
jgi:hypothetical protein